MVSFKLDLVFIKKIIIGTTTVKILTFLSENAAAAKLAAILGKLGQLRDVNGSPLRKCLLLSLTGSDCYYKYLTTWWKRFLQRWDISLKSGILSV